MLATLGTRKGLLELYHVPHDQQDAYSSGNQLESRGFGHLGFTVPDVAAALERLRTVVPDLQVIKPLGDDAFARMGVPAKDGEGDAAVHDGYRRVFSQLAFVRDPDGYWVELVPQVVL
jgi:lactoylglutathione lyase